MASIRDIDVAELFRLWASDMTNTELCRHFGINGGSLWSLRKKYALPVRPRVQVRDTTRRPDDPTPQEIAERAAWCREQRTAQEKARNDRAGRIRWTPPAYAYNGRDCSFTGVSH